MCYTQYISTLYVKLKNVKLATVIPVVFVVGGIAVNLLILSYFHEALSGFGGPEAINSEEDLFIDSLMAENTSFGDFTLPASDEDVIGFILVENYSLLSAANPLSTILPNRDGLMTYKIQEGDTLSGIAARFGISLNTILWANNELKTNLIRPGQEITLLPVSGVAHQVQEGDTLEAIATFYGVEASQIIKFNRKYSANYLPTGISIVIPGAKPKKNLTNVALAGLPDLTGYFVLPTTGWNWGRLHSVNAIDIANACGTSIYAAAEGLVIDEKSYGWNGGYGHYVDIEHPNKAVTRYSHTEKNIVSVGDYVLQGDLIAYIGNTGNTHGPTGCHLHFEVYGARNPFAK